MKRIVLLLALAMGTCHEGNTTGREKGFILWLLLNQNFFLYQCPAYEMLSSGAKVRSFPNGGPYWFSFAGTPGSGYTVPFQEAGGQDTRVYSRICNDSEGAAKPNTGVGQLEMLPLSFYAGRTVAFRVECISGCGSAFTITIP